MNIAQISTNLGDAGQNLLAVLVEHAPLLQAAEFRLDASTHLTGKDANTSTGTAARAEGSAGQRDAQVPSLVSRNLALYTREYSIDNVRRQDARVGSSPLLLKNFAQRRQRGLAAELAKEVQDHVFTGTDATNQMLGISTFVKDAAAGGQTTKLGFTTAELADMNYQVSLQLNSTSTQDQFCELLEEQIAEVPGANAIIVNAKLGARLTTMAKRYGAAGETVNSFGVRVPTYNGVPIIRVPTSTIPQTESDGSNNDCTSLYVVRFAEELGVCMSTNSGFYFQDFDMVDDFPQGVSRLEMFINLTVEKTDALRRLSRIRL